jgi:hypothetical protein
MLALVVAFVPPAWAQSAGTVEFSRGVGFAQAPGQAPRTLGQGLPLSEGDRLTTADGAFAIVRLQDGTKMTVRPGSELVLEQYKFREGAADNSMVMRLLRGGFRAITGLISKNAPSAARVQTGTSTIGIRGTDFDARLCSSGDCMREAARVADKPRPNAVLASAKVVSVEGQISAVDTNGQRRVMVAGAGVFPGELVETEPGTKAVLAFRDESRVTLGASTRFRIDNFNFDAGNPGEGRFLVSLLRGSVRALTGLIGRANTRNVGFTTPTATVGIRGTGLDLDCSDMNCAFFTWLGAIVVSPNGQTALDALLAGQGLSIGPDGIRPLSDTPLNDLPRPDGVEVNFQQLFGLSDSPEDREGLFVLVRDGHIEILTATEVLHLGRGEAGFADAAGRVSRPALMPRFLDYDLVPLPNHPNPLLASIMSDAGVRESLQCR